MPAVRYVIVALLLGVLVLAGCDPIQGSGNGTPLPPQKALFVSPADHTAVLTLQAGYPAGVYQFNFNGYQYGAMTVTVPTGWTLQVECVNRGTVDNSCAVVRGAGAKAPADPAWATPALRPGATASFTFPATEPGSYRITDLVPAREAAGAWIKLEVVQPRSGSEVPTVSASSG